MRDRYLFWRWTQVRQPSTPFIHSVGRLAQAEHPKPYQVFDTFEPLWYVSLCSNSVGCLSKLDRFFRSDSAGQGEDCPSHRFISLHTMCGQNSYTVFRTSLWLTTSLGLIPRNRRLGHDLKRLQRTLGWNFMPLKNRRVKRRRRLGILRA